MRSLRAESDGTCYRCRADAADRCDRCGRPWCSDHESHSRLCGRCHTEYLHLHEDTADAGRSAGQSFSFALVLLVAGFAAAKLWVHFGGRPSPSDFLFVCLPLAGAVGLTVMLLSSLLEDARAARRCERFIERPVRRRRRTTRH